MHAPAEIGICHLYALLFTTAKFCSYMTRVPIDNVYK